MKVYLCYFINDIEDIDLKCTLFNILPMNIINNRTDNRFFGLYAFTKKKELMKIFKSFHKFFFKYRVKDMTEDEYKTFKRENTNLLIRRMNIKINSKYKIELPMSIHEKNMISEFQDEIMYDILVHLIPVNPNVFSEKGINIVEKSGYNQAWIEINGNEEELDYIYYNMAFGLGRSFFELMGDMTELSKYIIIFNVLIDEEEILRYILSR